MLTWMWEESNVHLLLVEKKTAIATVEVSVDVFRNILMKIDLHHDPVIGFLSDT